MGCSLSSKTVNHLEQEIHFGNELDKLIERFGEEYDLTYAQITGLLQNRIFLLNLDSSEEDDIEDFLF